MPKYRWMSPYEWLEDASARMRAEELRQILLALALQTDSDTLQELLQTDMELGGYFRQVDQRGIEIPEDLVLLPNPGTKEEIERVFQCDWYEADRILMASAEAMDYLSESEPAEAGIDFDKAEILYVNDALKRCDSEQFYHA